MIISDLRFIDHHAIVAIAPYYHHQYQTEIIMNGTSIFMESNVADTVDELCVLYGSTLDGRIRATRLISKMIKKPPIMIALHHLFAAPLPNEQGDMMWLLHFDFTIQPKSPTTCLVNFKENKSLIIGASKNVIHNQRLRVSYLRQIFNEISAQA